MAIDVEPLKTRLIGAKVGAYEVEGLLGEGGLSLVFLARDAKLDRRVALKFLRPELTRQRDFGERFEQEARIAARLSHPGIAAVYSAEEFEGLFGLAMEYIGGTSWEREMQSRSLPWTEQVRIALAVIDALEYAWTRHGVVHRDIKPDNVMLTPERDVKLVDFGLAKVLREEEGSADLTAKGTFMGTPSYVSPEQARGKPLDFRADLYSLGICLFRAATQQLPFPGANSMDVVMRRLQEDPPSPAHLVPGLDPAISPLILRMMAREPADRFPDHASLKRALDAVRRSAVLAPVPSTEPTRPADVLNVTSMQSPASAGHPPGALDATRIVNPGRSPSLAHPGWVLALLIPAGWLLFGRDRSGRTERQETRITSGSVAPTLPDRRTLEIERARIELRKLREDLHQLSLRNLKVKPDDHQERFALMRERATLESLLRNQQQMLDSLLAEQERERAPPPSGAPGESHE